MPRIDTVRRSLTDFDLEGLNNIHNHIIKITVKNKVFKTGTIDSLKAVTIIQKLKPGMKIILKCLILI